MVSKKLAHKFLVSINLFRSRLISLLFLTLLISCDYDKKIEELAADISQLQKEVNSLKDAYAAGKIITNVEPLKTEEGGWEIRFSDNSVIDLHNGKNGTDGTDGITPYLKIDINDNWIVSYDNGKTYSVVSDTEGKPVSAKGTDGVNGVSVSVRENKNGYYEIVTYVENIDNPLNVISTPYSSDNSNKISSIVENSQKGNIVITMQNGDEYKFLQTINYPTAIVLLKKEYLITKKADFFEVEFRVNPSNATITRSDISVDLLQLKSYAESYVNTSQNYYIESLQKSVNSKGEILQGQYILRLGDTSKSSDYTETCTLVVTTKDSKENPIQITSESFTLKRNLNPEQELTDIEVCLPTDLYIMQGENTKLFYRGFIKAVNPYLYDIKVMSDIGKTYPRYYEIDCKNKSIPTGDYELILQVRDNNLNVLGTAQTTIHIVEKKQVNKQINTLCIGASATQTGCWPNELKRLINDDDVCFVGRKEGSVEKIKLEATGGWSWSDFMSPESTNSPFIKNGEINIKDYADKYSNGKIDLVITHLGVNTALYENNNWMQGELNYARQFIESYFAEYPDGSMIISAIPMPDEGINIYENSNTENNINRYGSLLTFMRYNSLLYDMVESYKQTYSIYYAPTNVFFDTDNAYPKWELDVNNRVDEKETIGVNGVHPTPEGSYMVADGLLPVFYEKIIK